MDPGKRTRAQTALHLASRWLPGLILAEALIMSLFAASTGWERPIWDLYGFRQTQTAISVQSMLQGGPWLAYETPVLGPPWSIPFEFPIYQWIVASITKLFGFRLEQTGRFISEAFFYLTLIPFFSVLGDLQVQKRHRLFFLTLLLSSPIYLFWSRTFMIESTALFFSAAYLACAAKANADAIEIRRRAKWLAWGAVFGMLGGATKVTTFFPFFGGAFLLYSSQLVRKRRALNRDLFVEVFALGVLPLVAITLWTQFADAQKLLNPLAAGFIDSVSLKTWNFGTIAQRLSPENWWHVVIQRQGHDILGSHAVLAALFVGLAVPGNRRRGLVLTSLLLFLATYLAFTNLHVVHFYYPYANGIFLIAALGFTICGLLEAGRWPEQTAAWLILFLALLKCGPEYRSHLGSFQEFGPLPRLRLASALEYATPPGEIALIYGLDWSPELPYYSHRRAIMDREERPLSNPQIARSLELLRQRGLRIGSLLACGDSFDHDAENAAKAKALGLDPAPVFSEEGCRILARRRWAK